MVATMKTKRMGWREAIDLLVGKRTEAVKTFDELVDEAARGGDLDPAAIDQSLSACGRSIGDFNAEIQRKAERIRLAGEVARLESLALEGDAADREINRLVSAHNAEVERLVKSVNERLEPLRLKVAEAIPARSQVTDLKGRLASGCDAELCKQSAFLTDRIGEVWRRLEDERERLAKWRRAAEALESNPDGNRYVQPPGDVEHQSKIVAKLEAELADLRAQADELEAAKVQA